MGRKGRLTWECLQPRNFSVKGGQRELEYQERRYTSTSLGYSQSQFPHLLKGEARPRVKNIFSGAGSLAAEAQSSACL